MLTGEPLPAAVAHQYGLVSELTPAGNPSPRDSPPAAPVTAPWLACAGELFAAVRGRGRGC
jgi:enoyl-CoA hydratase/carnithine racemase